jgi:hypothetical protein
VLYLEPFFALQAREETAMHPTQYLRRKDAAQYLKSKYGYGSARTLAKLACLGGGPIFRKVGRFILYTAADLDAWALSKISGPLASTSDANVA